MLLLSLFALLLFVCLFVFVFCFFGFCLGFFRNSNMFSIGTVEFRYYVVIIILVNFGKPEAIRD